MKKYVLILVQVLLVMVSKNLTAQASPSQSVPIVSPEGIFDIVHDRFGNQYSLSNLNLRSSHVIGGPNNINALPTNSCSAGYFTLWFVQGSLCDLNSQAATAMCQVFTDISNFISSPLTSTGVKVNILCANLSSTNTALATASSFYVFPINPTNPNQGIVEGQVHKAILTGIDPFLSIPSQFYNATSFYCGTVNTNTTTAWNYGTGATTLSPATFDFYSVILHEAMHSLGFLSLIDGNGYSVFGSNNNYFEKYDSFLFDHSGNPLLAGSSPVSCPNSSLTFASTVSTSINSASTGCVPDITPSATAVQYIGTSTVSVYTPNCFETGSSLSHFEDILSTPVSFTAAPSCTPGVSPPNNNLYFVMANATDSTTCYIKRFLKEEERNVLCDLGYSVNATYSSSAFFISGTSHSVSYSGGACSPPAVVYGINDGLVSGTYIYTTTSTSTVIPFSAILANDFPSAGLTVSCMELVYNNATLTIGSTDFTVNAASGAGLVLLKYLPKQISSGIFGNPTYVYLYFIPAGCNPPNLCSMVQNQSFESTNGCGPLGFNGNYGLNMNCWSAVEGNPLVYYRNCVSYGVVYNLGNLTAGTPTNSPLDSFNGPGNDVVLGFTWIYNNPNTVAIKNNLSTSMVPTNTYQVSFFVDNYPNALTGPPNNNPIVITIASAPAFAYSPPGTFPSGLDVIAEFTVNPGTSWSQLTNTFVFTPSVSANHSALIIGINPGKTASLPSSTWTAGMGSYVFIDEVSLIKLPAPAFVISSPSLCGGQSFTNLVQYASTTGTFSGSGVTNSGTQYDFNLTPTLTPGNYAIAFTYSNSSTNCLNTIYQVVTVSGTTLLNSAAVCLSTSTLDLNSLLTSTNYIGNGSFSVNGTTSGSTYTLGSAGTYTIGFTYTAGVLCNNLPSYSQVTAYTVPAVPIIYNVLTPISSFSLTCGTNFTPTAYGATNIAWQPGNLSGGSQVLSPSVTTIYTVTSFYNSVCVSSQTLSVFVPTNCCTSPSIPDFTTTSVTSNTFLSGILKISSDFTIQSGATCVFYGGEFIFTSNAKITVASGGVLEIQGSHLYACGASMWEGIVVQDGGLVFTSNYNGNDNLIEDAKIAMDVTNYSINTSTTILNIANTTFNKNYIDINLSNYPITSGTYANAISLNQCVFTCRSLTFSPTSWPHTSTGDLRSATNATIGLTAPYTLENAPIVNLKSPYASGRSHIAINIINAGSTQTLYPASSIFAFNFINIGSASGGTPTADFLLFDAHESFIAGANSNVKVTNSVFQNTQTFSISNTAGAAIQFTNGLVHTSLDLGAASSNVGNRFWDCHTAIDVKNGYSLKVENAIIRSTHNTSAPSSPTLALPGDRGIYINTNRFEDYSIQYNEFTNLTDAVSMVCAPGDFPGYAGWFEPFLGAYWNIVYARNVAVSNNTFCPVTSTSYTGATNNYLNNAITIGGPLNIWSTFSSAGLAAENNLMYRVGNGINFTGLNSIGIGFHVDGPPKIISSNTITLEESINWPVQTGITYAANLPAPAGFPTYSTQSLQTVQYNVLDVYNAPTTNASITLVYANGNGASGTVVPAPYMICNTITAAYNGFVFDGPNEPTYWRGNSMANLARGMTLMNTGKIGQQGNAHAPSDNQWTGSWSSGTFGAYMDNSNALSSLLYMQSGSPWSIPTPSGNVVANAFYGAPGSTLSASGSYDCNNDPYFQRVVALPDPHDYDSEDLYYIARIQAYRYLYFHDSIKSSDPGLTDFYNAHSGSSIEAFTQMEDKLSTGDFSAASGIMSGIDPGALGTVETNYYTFYDLYIKYTGPGDYDFTNGDRAALIDLAGLCPGTNGISVYQARALYLMMTGRVFNSPDACIESSGGRPAMLPSQNVVKTKNNWDVHIFPNPASTQLNIVSKTENEILKITIEDLSGRVILKKSMKLSGFIVILDLNLLNGAYLITIYNSNNEKVNKKLLIAK